MSQPGDYPHLKENLPKKKYEKSDWIQAMIMMLDLLFAGDLIIKEGSVGTKMYFIQVPPNSMNFLDEIKL